MHTAFGLHAHCVLSVSLSAHLILKASEVHCLGHALADDVDLREALLGEHTANGELDRQYHAVHTHHVVGAVHLNAVGRDLCRLSRDETKSDVFEVAQQQQLLCSIVRSERVQPPKHTVVKCGGK